MEPVRSVSYTQNPATGPHPVLREATWHPPYHIYDLFSFYSPIFAGVPQIVSLFQTFALEVFMNAMHNITHADEVRSDFVEK